MTWQLAFMIASSVTIIVTGVQMFIFERKIIELREKLDRVEGRTRLEVREVDTRPATQEIEAAPVAELVDYRGRAISPIPYEPPKAERGDYHWNEPVQKRGAFDEADHRHRDVMARMRAHAMFGRDSVTPIAPASDPPLRGKH